MINLHDSFQTFNSSISLNESKRKDLIKGRDALREKIRQNAKDNSRIAPKFCIQGSFAMKTTINPLGDKEFDLDDGLYLQGYDDSNMEVWPRPSDVHGWIKKAVDGHTMSPVIDKNTCVRVPYAKGYHIDLPSYILTDEANHLSHRRDGWVESDPKAFTDWFLKKVSYNGEQLRRIVKYLKAWKDFKEVNVKGMSLTILSGENIYTYVDRDDKALLGTVTNIINSLSVSFACYKPVNPMDEDLFSYYSYKQQVKIMESFKELRDNLSDSINDTKNSSASERMRIQFGDRFPNNDDDDYKNESSSFIKKESPGVIRNDGRSA